MSIQLNNAASTAVTFNQVSDTNSEAKYLASTASLKEPVYLVRKSTVQAPGSLKNDRFLTQIIIGKSDGDGAYGTVKVNLTIDVPRVGPGSADVNDALAFVESFLGDATLVASTLRGER